MNNEWVKVPHKTPWTRFLHWVFKKPYPVIEVRADLVKYSICGNTTKKVEALQKAKEDK